MSVVVLPPSTWNALTEDPQRKSSGSGVSNWAFSESSSPRSAAIMPRSSAARLGWRVSVSISSVTGFTSDPRLTVTSPYPGSQPLNHSMVSRNDHTMNPSIGTPSSATAFWTASKCSRT